MQLKRLAFAFDAQPDLASVNRVFATTVSSTNTLGRRIAAAYLDGGGPPRTVIVALEQTAGKGRLGRSWLSPQGGIYVSFVLSVGCRQHLDTLPMLLAIALCRELDGIVPAPCRIKWPNDLMVRQRKIGGILLESVQRGDVHAIVAGFGVNYSPAFQGLVPGATAIVHETSAASPIAEVTASLAAAVERQLGRIENGAEMLPEFALWSTHQVGERLQCKTPFGTVSGSFEGFDEQGFLRILTVQGKRRISSGEVIQEVIREP